MLIFTDQVQIWQNNCENKENLNVSPWYDLYFLVCNEGKLNISMYSERIQQSWNV